MGGAFSSIKCKPVIVTAAFPAHGHTYPLIHMSEYLVKQGFKVYFIGATELESSIRQAGAEYIANDYVWNTKPEILQGQFAIPDGPERHNFLLQHIFLDSIPQTYLLTRRTLETVRKRHPGRRVVILHETMFMGLLPFYYGVPLPKGYVKFPKVINVNTTMNSMSSVDVFPGGLGYPPAISDEDRAAVKAMNEAMLPTHKILNNATNDAMRQVGTTKAMTGSFLDTVMNIHDVTLLPFSPSIEFPRSDLDPKIRFIGGLPLKPLKPNLVYPSWWPEVLHNASLPASSPSRKKLVFIAQGTVAIDYTELVIPGIISLESRADVLVIATLGSRGATLQADFQIPANTRVIDYFPYDAILRHADVFVFNAGFGGYMHSIMNGVPMVLSGTAADKSDCCMRAEWSGVGVNLRAERPSEKAIAEGVEKVLRNSSYKQRALELKKENEDMDALGTLEKIIWEFS
ncbi:glycosyltransferase family 1 protein [Thozetella sp. PMI_491]|nr:glycosyltransferase family 1 protein [Thozetella sp. PMI_491]